MIYFYPYELSKRFKKYIFPLLGTTDVLEKTEYSLSSYLKNIWTEMTLSCENPTGVEWDKMIFSSFAADNTGLHHKNKGIVMLQKNLLLLQFRTS